MCFLRTSPRHWVLQYSYVDDAFEKRGPLRPAHLALASQYKAAGKMLMGGAFAEKPMGALLTFYTTRGEVENFVKQDPYVQAGADKKIVTDYAIREWTVVVGSSSNPNYAGVEPVKVGDKFPPASKGLHQVGSSSNAKLCPSGRADWCDCAVCCCVVCCVLCAVLCGPCV